MESQNSFGQQSFGFLAQNTVSRADQRFSSIQPMDRRVWGAIMASNTDVNADNSIPGWEASEFGFAVGLELHMTGGFGNPVTVGVAAGYIDTDVGVLASDADVESFYAGFYAATELGQLSLSGSAAFGYHKFGFDRRFNAGGAAVAANGDADGYGFSSSVEAFYDLSKADLNGGYFGPIATLGTAFGNRDAFTETGAGILNLAVTDDDAAYAKIGLGIAAGTEFELDGTTIKFDGRIQWEHLFGDADVTTLSAISSASASFSTTSASVDRDRLGVGFGLGVEVSGTASAHLRYNGSFGADTTSHDLSAGITVRF
ncbi:MAG: autotransporter outer membrane beta-barrel domain-containing protein [Pseudomonadota bacterium]